MILLLVRILHRGRSGRLGYKNDHSPKNTHIHIYKTR